MAEIRQHEVVRDTTVVFGAVLKKLLAPRLEPKVPEVVFDLPDDAKVAEAAKDGKVLVSLLMIELVRSNTVQTSEQSIVREEDKDGNIAEFRVGAPTYLKLRYVVTPWLKDALESQAVHGLIMQTVLDYAKFTADDLQGTSIKPDSSVPIEFDDKFAVEEQARIFQAFGRNLRPSLVFTLTVRLESLQKQLIRRVKERILDYKKVRD